MKTGEQLISVMDIASLATDALTQEEKLLYAIMAFEPADSKIASLCKEIIDINKEAQSAIAYEKGLALQEASQRAQPSK